MRRRPDAAPIGRYPIEGYSDEEAREVGKRYAKVSAGWRRIAHNASRSGALDVAASAHRQADRAEHKAHLWGVTVR